MVDQQTNPPKRGAELEHAVERALLGDTEYTLEELGAMVSIEIDRLTHVRKRVAGAIARERDSL